MISEEAFEDVCALYKKEIGKDPVAVVINCFWFPVESMRAAYKAEREAKEIADCIRKPAKQNKGARL